MIKIWKDTDGTNFLVDRFCKILNDKVDYLMTQVKDLNDMWK